MFTATRDFLAGHRRARDAVPAAVLVVVSVFASMAGGGGWHGPAAGPVLWMAAACLPLVWRSRYPMMVTAVVFAVEGIHLAVVPDAGIVPGAGLVALYTLASRLPRPTSWVIGLSASVLMTVALAAARSESVLSVGALASFDLLVLAVAIGDTTRSRRAYLAALRERAEQAEHSREDEAARRVTAERVRIARDLHDVVAHHITLVNAQAGVAQHLVRTDAEAAHRALGRLKETSRAALDELRATVGLLRQDDDTVDPRAPTPRLDDLEDLAATFRRAGLPVEVTLTGVRRPPSPSVELAAYRIIQEALTNTRKHAGPATAHVRVDYGEHVLRLDVTDDGRRTVTPDKAGSGHGLIGMRERAHAFGGTLGTGPAPTGGFRVTAELPLPPALGDTP
ncbi:sensor histidine kinase [Streptomyces sp. SID3343]|uniref:sensor histidine kinase n=1 Tax=Streptomyces sp. SID3343 TaxID=2690260 RepID=UPI001370D542|nr:sensor histidine kinase [Streptomyces sp. SID3343]MYW01886.1 sensor histidine kinase [Streptomyces sp. SID3343]